MFQWCNFARDGVRVGQLTNTVKRYVHLVRRRATSDKARDCALTFDHMKESIIAIKGILHLRPSSSQVYVSLIVRDKDRGFDISAYE